MGLRSFGGLANEMQVKEVFKNCIKRPSGAICMGDVGRPSASIITAFILYGEVGGGQIAVSLPENITAILASRRKDVCLNFKFATSNSTDVGQFFCLESQFLLFMMDVSYFSVVSVFSY